MGFYESNDPTNNVKAPKEDRVLRIRLWSHQEQLHQSRWWSNPSCLNHGSPQPRLLSKILTAAAAKVTITTSYGKFAVACFTCNTNFSYQGQHQGRMSQNHGHCVSLLGFTITHASLVFKKFYCVHTEERQTDTHTDRCHKETTAALSAWLSCT